jgi:hypothetical protein
MTKKKEHPEKRGRKSKWESHVKGRLNTIRTWRKLGLRECDICAKLGVGKDAFNRYKKIYPELREALKTGKEEADAAVIDALWKRAVGYEVEETETTAVRDADGKLTGKVQLRKYKKHIQPNVLAQIFYLKNRRPHEWRDRQIHEMTGPDGKPLHPPVIHAYIPDNGRDKSQLQAVVVPPLQKRLAEVGKAEDTKTEDANGGGDGNADGNGQRNT